MAVQVRLNNQTNKLILSDDSLVRNGTIAQYAGRTTPILQNTVVAFNATSRQWVPFNSLVQTNGESVPRGIYLGDDLLAADVADDDIEDCAILVGNATVDEDLLIWDDDTLSANSIVNPATIEARTAMYALIESAGIFIEDTIAISEQEN